MSDRSQPPKNRIIVILVVVIACLAAAWFAWRSVVPPTPTLLAKSVNGIDSPEYADGAWYWIENANTPSAHLVRSASSTISPVPSTEQIRSFSVSRGKIAWIAGDGKSWNISVAGTDGNGRSGIWSGDRQPSGLYLDADRLYWLEAVPALVPNSGPMPPLGPTLRVLSAPVAGGAAPTVISSMMESVGLKVLGIHDGRIYASASRAGLQDVTTVYEMPLTGGPAKRIAAEVGNHSTALLPDGSLYWTSPSREAAEPEKVVCIWKMGADGKPQPIQDWLPFGGRLFATGSGVSYIDGGYYASVWPIGAPGGLPQSIHLPGGYKAVAVGNGEVLLQPSHFGNNAPLYRLPLP